MIATTLRVLLAESEFTETGLTLRSLCAEAGWSLELIFVDTPSQLAHALQSYCPDVAFVQLALLQPDAPALLRALHQSHPSIPFILFAPPADIACAVSCLSTGASDFMLEGFMDEQTMARVLCSAMDLPQFERLEIIPPAPNSPWEMHPVWDLTTQVAVTSNPASHQNYALSVAIENPEYLKIQFGEDTAEHISQELGRLLRTSVRPRDLLIPVSCGKWILYFQGIRHSAGASILQRIRSNVRSYRPSLLPCMELTLIIAAESCGNDVRPASPRSLSAEATLFCSPDVLIEVS